jgi:hypothetical protein
MIFNYDLRGTFTIGLNIIIKSMAKIGNARIQQVLAIDKQKFFNIFGLNQMDVGFRIVSSNPGTPGVKCHNRKKWLF